MSKTPPPFNDYHRRALGALARDIAKAQAERETAEVLARARVPLAKRGCTGPCAQGRRPDKCPTDCGHHLAQHAQTPSPWLAEESNAMAAMLPPTWLQRFRTKLRLFVDGWIDPTVRS